MYFLLPTCLPHVIIIRGSSQNLYDVVLTIHQAMKKMLDKILVLFLLLHFLVCFAITGGTLLIIGGEAFIDYPVKAKVLRLSFVAIYDAILAYIFVSHVFQYFRRSIDVNLLAKLAIYLSLPWFAISSIIFKWFSR
jgi:hypothetical protein